MIVALLVPPVGGDAVLGHVMHFLGADLHLDALLLGPDHGGVDGAVVVALGRRDVILEAARHHGVGGVDVTERLVTGGDVRDDHAKRHNVGELLE